MSDLVELEVLEGLAPILAEEAREAGFAIAGSSATALMVRGPATAVPALRCAVAAYSVRAYPVPRPRGLLGDSHLRSLARQVEEARAAGGHRSFRLSAAGSDSAVFQRLASELAARTGLVQDAAEGEMLLRVRRAGAGWEVLARLTPRPLSARPWRVRDVPGALNATIAAAMVRLLRPRPGGRFLNLMCGTGTLLVERGLAGRARVLCGLEIGSLEASRANLGAAGIDALLVRGDAVRPPFAPDSFGELCADLPYGQRSGSVRANDALYRGFLSGAASVAAPAARMAVITHDIRRFEAALSESAAWRAEKTLRVFQKGYRPQIWLLHRRG